MSSDSADVRIAAFATSPSSKLDLSNCHLENLPASLEALSESSAAASLTILNLATNKLHTLPAYLSNFPNLRILFCPNNAFTTLPSILPTLRSITMLSFKNNALSSIQDDDFPHACRNVRKLMLSNNNLSTLPTTLHHMTSLQLIRLANNNFSTFPYPLLSLPRLIWLALGGNPCTGGSPSPSDIPHNIGDLNAIYSIEWSNPFGSGASGTTYPATHRESGQRVAVKKFTAMEGSDGRALDEMSVSVRAREVEGVTRVIGHGYADDAVCMVMEIVEGKSLADGPSFESCTRSVYREGGISEEDAKRICQVVRKSVEGLRKVQVAHGDVYAHNIIVGEDVVLGDLGAAWVVPQDVSERVAVLEDRAIRVLEEEVWGKVGK